MDTTDEVDEDDQLLNYAIQLSIEESWSNDFPARYEKKRKEKIFIILTFIVNISICHR